MGYIDWNEILKKDSFLESNVDCENDFEIGIWMSFDIPNDWILRKIILNEKKERIY